MSIFENPALDLKKRNIITSSASALPISAGYLYALCFDAATWSRGDHNAAKYKSNKIG
jgi:hypothetical protein